MDLNDYWQENKRFVVTLASGVIVFVIGSMLVDNFFRKDLVAQKRSADAFAGKMKSEAMYSADDLATAQKENEDLKKAVDVLQTAVAFAPRAAFRFDPSKGSASNQYFAVVSSVREELLTLAGRANLRMPEDLGLPTLSPTKEQDIVLHLEALDLIDRASRIALSAGVERIDKIDIKLDPRLTSRQGVGDLEKTRVVLTLSGRPTPLVQFLTATQGDKDGGPLLIEKCEMVPARGKSDEAGLEVTFVVARLHAPAAEKDEIARDKKRT